jgi:pentose-5-phosphate-3-epimerase
MLASKETLESGQEIKKSKAKKLLLFNIDYMDNKYVILIFLSLIFKNNIMNLNTLNI